MSKPSKRTALTVLTIKRLAGLCDHFDIDRAGLTLKDDLIATLARSKTVSFAAILETLSRQELKAICRTHELDESGKAKAMLVARILGEEPTQVELLASVAAPDEPKAAKQAKRAKQAGKRAKQEPNDERSGSLGFEDKLWAAADLLRNNMDPAEYKHVVLGLIFLKYISDAFEERQQAIIKAASDPKNEDYVKDPGEREDELAERLEERDEYTAENVFWVPPVARWHFLQGKATQAAIGKLIDDAMVAIEQDNPPLKGALAKVYASANLDKQKLGELINLIGSIGLGTEEHRKKDTLGAVYQYFLARFASAEGKGGGEFYTPTSVVRVLVEMLEPYRGRVYDPCCGSGGMFVQSLKFIKAHNGRRDDVSIYGQESNPTTWKMAKMNLAIRGIEAKLGHKHADSFLEDLHPDLRADFIIANPPFNISKWGGEQLQEDVRWEGWPTPPASNANFGWLLHIVHHLSPSGTAGVVLANGSMSSMQSGEGEIRRKLVEADLVDCMVALPGQLFYATQIPVCLWFLARNRRNGKFRDRRGEILLIDARKLGRMETRVHRVFDDADIERIAETYHAWRNKDGAYEDVAGFCKSASLAAVAGHEFVLTPGRYVGAAESSLEDTDRFAEKLAALAKDVKQLFIREQVLNARIQKALEVLADE